MSSLTMLPSDVDAGHSNFIPTYFPSDEGPPGIQESGRILAMYYQYTFCGMEGTYFGFKTSKKIKC